MESTIYNQDCDDCGNRMLLCLTKSIFTCTRCGLSRDACIMTLSLYTDDIGYKIRKIKTYSRLKQFERVLRRNPNVPEIIIHVMRSRFSHLHSYYVARFTERRNFLKYSYLIFKMLCLLARPDLASTFELPRTQKTMDKYEIVWKDICCHFGWLYIKSTVNDKLYWFPRYLRGLNANGLRLPYM